MNVHLLLQEQNAPRKRVIPAIISTSVANKPYTFNDIYKLENIQQLFTNEITDNVEEENTWTDGKTSGHIIFRFPSILSSCIFMNRVQYLSRPYSL